MQREIIFRGKRLDNGEWAQGWYGQYQTKHYISFEFYGDGVWSDYSHVVDPATVGQYVGLKDKNGAKIFEGDILRSYHFKSGNKQEYLFHRVEWSEKYCQFLAISIGNESNALDVHGNIFLWVYLKNGENITVIGSIHDNPELLK